MSGTHSRKKRRMDTTGDFDLVVVGCGGGHDETNLSGYLLKSRDKPWSAGLLGLEAGSGYGVLKRLLSTTHPNLFSSLFPSQPQSAGSKSSKPTSPSRKISTLSPTEKAHIIFSHLRVYLLTHAHLDHTASLIISSGSLSGPTRYIFGARGVLEDLERCIWGPGRCWPRIVGWEEELAAEGSEPVDGSRHGGAEHGGVRSRSEARADVNTAGGILRSLKVAASLPSDAIGDRDEEYTPIGLEMNDVLVRVVPVSHGCGPKGRPYPQNKDSSRYLSGEDTNDKSDKNTKDILCGKPYSAHSLEGQQEVYKSSAFFIRHSRTRHEFLFFGDVEADPVPASSTRPPSALNAPSGPNSTSNPLSRPLLLPIWQHAAHLFHTRRLHTLLIECSYPAGRPEAQLFGHLSVEGLRREMRVLAEEVVKLRKTERPPKKDVVEPTLNDTGPQPVDTHSIVPRRSRRIPTRVEHPNQSRPTKGTKRKAESDPTPTIRPLCMEQLQATTPNSSTSDLFIHNIKLARSSDPLKDALTGLRVIVIHCKEPTLGFDLAGTPTIADFIVRQLKDGVAEPVNASRGIGENGAEAASLGPDELGIDYVAAHQGDEFGKFPRYLNPVPFGLVEDTYPRDSRVCGWRG